MVYFCGWDGGGSKTTVLCADENGKELARKTFGPLNINGAPQETVATTIADALAFMKSIANLDQFRTLAIGAAGVSNFRVVDFITDQIRQRGYTNKLLIVGDHEIALESLHSESGAVLIAGTGSICIGKDNQGNRARAGGFGYLIDDCGSGYSIGRDILAAIVRAHDGRGCKTCLTEMTLEHLGAPDIPHLIAWLYNSQTDKKDIAALTPLLSRALEVNDPAAKQIALSAAKELTMLITAVWKKLNLYHGELILTGSILEHFSLIRDEVCRLSHAFCPEIDVIIPQDGACEGALKLAMKA